ncbi:sigma-E factor negative regulatory protein [Parendozoicomonas sp. Alg238-R29]|uniref:sigma-E factor negative regulatory protein n=1 Tax=Parendozoicomonas sp. Alg238-R29 TaxID=2993446 RepID=UPI00248D57D0|nr:sigma-E factor negative regulatory protein [Parendozoicomonas sp. Alg238-R29]
MGDTSKKTQQHLRESLSALMDGEANEFEMHKVLEQLGEDRDLRDAALGYQRIGEAIRHESNDFSGVDLSSSISAALADGPAPEMETASNVHSINSRKGLFANLGRLAVAASVAAATVVGVQTWNVANRNDADAGVELATVETVPVQAPVPVNVPSGHLPSADMFGARGLQASLGINQSGMTPEQMNQARIYADRVAQSRFRAYMLEHAEQTTASESHGIVPFVRAASFEITPGASE